MVANKLTKQQSRIMAQLNHGDVVEAESGFNNKVGVINKRVLNNLINKGCLVGSNDFLFDVDMPQAYTVNKGE